MWLDCLFFWGAPFAAGVFAGILIGAVLWAF